MGNASIQDLFDCVKARRVTDPAKPVRDVSDYRITLDGNEMKEFKAVVLVQ